MSTAQQSVEHNAIDDRGLDPPLTSLNVPAGVRTRDSIGRSQRFNEFAERLARFFGTGQYIFWQTIVLIVWIAINVAVKDAFDPSPFKFLNLVFSTQAAYAAPLILLAQWRQAGRERQGVELDRRVALRTTESTRYLTSELSNLRLGLTESVTTSDLERRVRHLTQRLDQLADNPALGSMPPR